MQRRCGLGLVAVLLLAAEAAMAQGSDGKARIACDRHAAPAFAKDPQPPGSVMDCACISAFLVGRYGDADAEVIIRLLAAGAEQSNAELRAVAQHYGQDTIRRVAVKVGKFQDMGRDVDKACPPVAKPQ